MQIRPLLIKAAVGALAAIAVGCATTAQNLCCRTRPLSCQQWEDSRRPTASHPVSLDSNSMPGTRPNSPTVVSLT